MIKLLTLCVATYNMEKYLDRCLSSVTALEINSKLEVIVVNDGSKDRSLEIAKAYEQQRPDIVTVVDKINGNYGSCVNTALKIATGKYFRMLDADDWFDTLGLKLFLETLECVDTDLVISNFTKHTLKGKQLVKLPSVGKIKYGINYSSMDFNVEESLCDPMFCMHAMTYKLSVIKESGLKHLEGISYTDTEYCYYPSRYIQNLYFVDIDLYQYDLTREGQTVSAKSLFKSSKHIEMVADKMILNEEKYKEALPISSFFVHAILNFYYKSFLVDCPFEKTINRELSLFDEKMNYYENHREYIDSLQINHIKYVRVWKYFNKSYIGKKLIEWYLSVFKIFYRIYSVIKCKR